MFVKNTFSISYEDVVILNAENEITATNKNERGVIYP